MYVHVTLNATRCPRPLHCHEVAAVLWRRLREAFPDAVACTIMPEHVHLLARADGPKVARRRSGYLLSSLKRSRLAPEVAAIEWVPATLPREIPNQSHLARQVRYVALNPCRRRLVGDPLSWVWSTHRDVAGAVADPWVSPDRLAAALGRSPRRFAERHHAYVSGDPSVLVSGTAFPSPAVACAVESHPLTWVREAAAAATRGRPEDVGLRGGTRALFVLLARHVGWTDAARLVSQCNMSPHGIRAALKRATRADHTTGLAAGLLCLGDPRLRVGFESQLGSDSEPLAAPPVHPYG